MGGPRNLVGLWLALVLVGLIAAPAAQAGARADARALMRLLERGDRELEAEPGGPGNSFDERRAACPVNEEDAPESANPRIFAVIVSLSLRDAVAPHVAAAEAYATQLEAYRSRDRALRGTAKGVARSLRLIREMARTAPEVCAYFAGWQAAGWALDYRIAPPARNLTAEEGEQLERAGRSVRRGERRLRRLGISRRRAERALEGARDLSFLVECDL